MKKDKKLVVLVLMLLFISTSKVNINHAKTITNCTQDISKEFAYTFKVSDKLDGAGEILLSIENNLIKGTATGLGMTCQCNIDFESTRLSQYHLLPSPTDHSPMTQLLHISHDNNQKKDHPQHLNLKMQCWGCND